MKTQWGEEVQLYSFSTWALDGGVFNTTPRPFYPREREPVPIVWEAGCAPGPAGTGAENLAPTGI